MAGFSRLRQELWLTPVVVLRGIPVAKLPSFDVIDVIWLSRRTKNYNLANRLHQQDISGSPCAFGIKILGPNSRSRSSVDQNRKHRPRKGGRPETRITSSSAIQGGG
jgi:hypothetical protein